MLSAFCITLYFIIVETFANISHTNYSGNWCRIYSGNFTGGATPVPIPNTEVKPTEVDGTVVSRPWESRTLPVSFPPAVDRRKIESKLLKNLGTCTFLYVSPNFCDIIKIAVHYFGRGRSLF